MSDRILLGFCRACVQTVNCAVQAFDPASSECRACWKLDECSFCASCGLRLACETVTVALVSDWVSASSAALLHQPGLFCPTQEFSLVGMPEQL